MITQTMEKQKEKKNRIKEIDVSKNIKYYHIKKR